MQFLNTFDDCQWLRNTHLGGRTDLVFGAFMLYGNEACPTKVDLYPDPWPLASDEPHTITFI